LTRVDGMLVVGPPLASTLEAEQEVSMFCCCVAGGEGRWRGGTRQEDGSSG
jgi:hypothetical protein